jgi:uncharacterized membrane protein (DUF485 family)
LATIEQEPRSDPAIGRDVLESAEFHQLVFRRWRTSLALTAGLFLDYYGYIWLVATNRALLTMRLGETPITVGIVLGVAVIVLSWALTAAYVVWANRHYDPEVRRLRELVR